MANPTLHIAKPESKPSLYEELRRYVAEAAEMEEAIRGVAGVLDAIDQGGLLNNLPRDEEDHEKHEAATDMLRLVANHLKTIRDHERDWDLSCELAFMADEAKDGRLIGQSAAAAAASEL